jgi:hypothetical protein
LRKTPVPKRENFDFRGRANSFQKETRHGYYQKAEDSEEGQARN